MEIVMSREKLSDLFENGIYLGEGYEGVVYRKKDTAYKIYHEDSKKHCLNYSQIIEFSQIPTQRILMPQNPIVSDENRLLGYTLPAIDNYQKETMLKQNTEKFIDELFLLERDSKILRTNNIAIWDLMYQNFVYNGSIYLIDPGSYEKKAFWARDNQRVLNEFIITDLLGTFFIKKGGKRKARKIINDYLKTEGFIGWRLEEEMKDCEDVGTYIKKVLKKK